MKIDINRYSRPSSLCTFRSLSFIDHLAKFSISVTLNETLRHLTLALIFFVTPLASRGQDVSNILPPSPNAASLGIYGQIPVSLFNGLPQISVPLGNVSLDGTNIDISLGYHGGGVHPEDHPGWVGLGWNLNAGGSITRRVAGPIDEITVAFPDDHTALSYYNHADYLDNNNWTSWNSITSFVGKAKPVPDPDEFIFNFGGYSGSFYLNHKGIWQVKSEQPLHLEIKEQLENNYSLAAQANNVPITIKRILYKFTITTPDGNQYIFGGTPQSVEFTRNQLIPDSYNGAVAATTWYLTKIVTNKNKVADFVYERGNIIIPVSAGVSIYSERINANNFNRGGKPETSISVINPVYLTEINTINESVKFTRSISNDLKYYYEDLIPQLSSLADAYPDLDINGRGHDVASHSNWQKLDAITFYTSSSKLLKKINFSYTDNSTSRLMLNSVRESGSDGMAKPSYKFLYDITPLPPYNSRKIDHWGFYNGRDWFGEQTKYSTAEQTFQFVYTLDNISAYTQSRSSNLAIQSAGNLKSIQYPTGGKTFFDFEAHDYTGVAQRYPFVVEGVTQTQCGGLRIRKIWDEDKPSVISNLREYRYVSNYQSGGSSSSGILGGFPVYAEIGTAQYNQGAGNVQYWYWYDFPIEPLSYTNGNHVTYSEVVEKLQDGSYTIYKYSNHDQEKYRDVGAIYSDYSNIKSSQMVDPNISLALDRGKLLRKRLFNSAGIPQQDTQYEYDEKIGRGIDSAVRAVRYKQRIYNFGMQIVDHRTTAYVNYTFPRLIKKEITSTFDSNGLNPVTIEKRYGYDSYSRNVVRDTLVRSNAQLLTTSYSYPQNMLSNDPTGVYNAMRNANILSPVIEKSIYANGALVTNEKTSYFSPHANIYVPKTFERNPQYTKVYYNNYDSNGNLLSFSDQGLKTTNYIWSYNNSFPVAEVVNLDYLSVQNSLGTYQLEAFRANPNPNKLEIDQFLAKLKRDYPDAFISSFAYEPGSGLSSKTDPKGQNTDYEYDNFQRLLNIKDQSGNIVKNFRYHYAGPIDPEIPGNPGYPGTPDTPDNPDTPVTPVEPPKFSNVAISQSFTRTNCGTGFSGGTVAYVVEAGKHTATTQAAADALANADLLANGPNYANQSAACTPICEGEQFKLVSGICETGIKIIRNSVFKPGPDNYLCTYYYKWSDGKTSPDYTETNSEPCVVN